MSNLHLSLYPPPAASDASSSGRATPSPIKPKRMKRKTNPNRSSSTPTSVFKTNNVSPCSECGKQFNTWKALFGHMRCHPERQWRGMNKKSKLKQKQQDWAHNTDEVTKAALILMQMSSGLSFREVSVHIERSRERRMRNLDIDLNFPPPVEE